MSEIGAEARRFTRGQQAGVLSTLSKRLEGFPFGSVAPFMLDHDGCPIILISDIAEHSKNIAADPRVSLIVQPWSADMQSTGRVTLIGHAQQLDSKDSLGPRYLRYFPQAVDYFAMHDFRFYRIEPVRVRWIGGFGKIHWVEPAAYLTTTGQLAEAEEGIVTHMNTDHADTLTAYCRHIHGEIDPRPEMVGIDPDGFDLRSGQRLIRFPFASPVLNATDARAQLIEMAKQCLP